MADESEREAAAPTEAAKKTQKSECKCTSNAWRNVLQTDSIDCRALAFYRSMAFGVPQLCRWDQSFLQVRLAENYDMSFSAALEFATDCICDA